MTKVLTVIIVASLLLNAKFFYNRYVIKQEALADKESQQQLSLKTKQVKFTTIAELPVDSNSILFLGNSLTEAFPITEMSGNINIRNRGISGATLDDMLRNIQTIVKIRPCKVFIEIGINDLKNNMDHLLQAEDTLISNYTHLVAYLESRHINVYIQGLPPVNDNYFHEDSGRMNDIIARVNNQLQQICSEKGCTYIDLFTPLLKDGALNTHLSFDGLHLNILGYRVWYNSVKTLI
jgi:lysophospholipase L1-like esterase